MGTPVDVIDVGTGPPVVLLHSSVSGNRQWKALIADLRDRHRVLAINLLGYGDTPPWSGDRPQRLTDQAALVHAAIDGIDEPVSLVGHSFGGAVAMQATLELGDRVRALVLRNPTPSRCSRGPAARTRSPRPAPCGTTSGVTAGQASGTSSPNGSPTTGSATGPGLRCRSPRRAAFVAALVPNQHEWDAVADPDLVLDDLPRGVPTLVVHDPATRRPIRELVEVLREARPDWCFRTLAEGGHMAPLTRPDLVDPIVVSFLAES